MTGLTGGRPNRGRDWLLGERIEVARKAKKLTRAQLGERIGVSKDAIEHWETAGVTPRPNLLATLEEVLEVKLTRGGGVHV